MSSDQIKNKELLFVDNVFYRVLEMKISIKRYLKQVVR
nr:MAG TPA: hypothetical protein [Caudoviricetes sp.]